MPLLHPPPPPLQTLPHILTHHTLALPALSGTRGVYVVECMGDGIACRALVRIGYLTCVDTVDARGHVFCVYDEELRPVVGASVTVAGVTYVAGGIAVEYEG